MKAAEQRADPAGLAIQYRQAAIEDRPDLGEFDLAIGRYILSHQPDPTSFMRTVSSYVRQGGVIAFHEALVTRDLLQLNRAPLWQSVVDVTISAFGAAMRHPDVGARLVETFHAAGLDGATVWCDVMTYCQPDNPVFAWFSLVLKSSLPHIERLGLVTAAELDADTLEDRLRVEAASLHSQVMFPVPVLRLGPQAIGVAVRRQRPSRGLIGQPAAPSRVSGMGTPSSPADALGSPLTPLQAPG